MTASTAILVRFLEKLTADLQDFTAELRAAAEHDGRTSQDQRTPIGAEVFGRGKRQRQILALPSLAMEKGLRTSEIAQAIDYDQANVWSTLQTLRHARLVESVPDSSPQRWRLVDAYRPAAQSS